MSDGQWIERGAVDESEDRRPDQIARIAALEAERDAAVLAEREAIAQEVSTWSDPVGDAANRSAGLPPVGAQIARTIRARVSPAEGRSDALKAAALRELVAEHKALVDALYNVKLEYDSSEDGQNALIMYGIASDTMDAIRARSNKDQTNE